MGTYTIMPSRHHTVHQVIGTHESTPPCAVFFNDEAVFMGTHDECTAYINTVEPGPMCWVVMRQHYVDEAAVTAAVFADFHARMA